MSAILNQGLSRTFSCPVKAPCPAHRWRSRTVQGRSDRLRVSSAEGDTISGVVFQPFSEAFHPECEAAINEQINIEYSISYVYHAMYAYFDRDNVGLPGLAAFFKAGSAEERGHAQLLVNFQNKRGGRVKLGSSPPLVEFYHKGKVCRSGPRIGSSRQNLFPRQKGEALHAMELALSLERLNFLKLRELLAIGWGKHGDAAMKNFVENQLLREQVDGVKEVSEYVAQLRRVGKGLGVMEFDREMAAKFADV
eukprot:gene2880-17099_t